MLFRSSNEVWTEVYDKVAQLIETHRTTLIFVNTRRMAERVAHQLTELLGEDKVSSHHGSLSMELRLRTERLELRLPNETELQELAALAEKGVHPPDEMPFRVAWTDGIGTPEFRDNFIAFHLDARRNWTPERWNLVLGVWADGEPVGTQSVDAVDFAARRTAETGSWLGQRFQGRGIGTEMREAILTLLFDGLGGEVATSGYIAGNERSRHVSDKLGYVVSGEGTVAPRGTPVREIQLALDRATWKSVERPRVELVDLSPCLPLFGAESVPGR